MKQRVMTKEDAVVFLDECRKEFANKDDVYTKEEVDDNLNEKADTSLLGGLSFQKITKEEYDILVASGNVEPNVMYIIVK